MISKLWYLTLVMLFSALPAPLPLIKDVRVSRVTATTGRIEWTVTDPQVNEIWLGKNSQGHSVFIGSLVNIRVGHYSLKLPPGNSNNDAALFMRDGDQYFLDLRHSTGDISTHIATIGPVTQAFYQYLPVSRR